MNMFWTRAAFCLVTMNCLGIAQAEQKGIVPTQNVNAASAQPSGSAIDPRARLIFSQMTATYQTAHSLSETLVVTGPAPILTAQIAYQHPNLVNINVISGTPQAHIVSDGHSLFINSADAKTHYYKLPVQPKKDIVVGAFSLASDLGVFSPTQLELAGKDLLGLLGNNLKSAAVLPASHLGNTPVDVVKLGVENNAGQVGTFTFEIGQTDHLLRRLTIAQSPTDTLVETHTNIRLNAALPASQFAFVPPAGAKAVTSLEPPMYDPRLQVGKAPFPINSVDLNGKAISLAQYRGKVVLLDFWATWCGPCVEEIPNLASAYQTYHARGFNIVGFPQEHDPSKAHLQTFLRQHHMTWRQAPMQPQVAERYGIQAFPMMFLIGKNGRIAAIDVRGQELQAAIRAALKK